MTTETIEKPSEAPALFKLALPRKAIKTGMPTDGLWVIAGLAKSGKTTLAASRKNAVIMEMERGGADRIDGWVQEIPDLQTFRMALMTALKDPSVEAIVIDTLDVLLDYIGDDVASEFGLENLNERKEGINGFAVSEELRKRVVGLINTLKKSNKLIIALAHFKDPRLDSDGKLVISQTINARGKLASYICGQADVIGHSYKKPAGTETQYWLSFQGGGMLGTFGGRVSELEGKTILLPRASQWSAIEAVFAPAQEPKTETTTKKKNGGSK